MKIQIEIDDKMAALLQAHADENGVTIDSIIQSDRAVKDIVREKLHQALGRELNEGKMPQDLIDSAVAYSAKAKAEREKASKGERLKV